MSTVQELKAVVKETLENRGVLSQIKARIRAEVFSALDDQSDAKPSLSNENMLINELIREYLEFNKYKYTSSVLMAESGQPKTPLDREFLTNELNIAEDQDTATVPLLYGILSHFLNRNQASLPLTSRHRSHQPRPSDDLRARLLEPSSSHADVDVSDYIDKAEPYIVHGGRR